MRRSLPPGTVTRAMAAPIVDGPCKCHACGRKFACFHDRDQHAQRLHFKPIKGPLIQFNQPSQGGLLAVFAAVGLFRSRRQRRKHEPRRSA
jgi:MYXO-CTERM domain-containing protein